MLIVVSNVNDTQPAPAARRILADDSIDPATVFVSLRMESQTFSGASYLAFASTLVLLAFSLY
jgi:hypothetical protein